MAELIETQQLGPTIDESLVECKRRKLQFDNYFVDKVTVYETEIGVEAMRF